MQVISHSRRLFNGVSSFFLQMYYWNLPTQFTGNKLGSYGGELKFAIRNNKDQQWQSDGRPLVEIKVTTQLLIVPIDHARCTYVRTTPFVWVFIYHVSPCSTYGINRDEDGRTLHGCAEINNRSLCSGLSSI